MDNFWRKCSTCKSPVPFGGRYYVCSVSTCNGQRTGYIFCSIPCWEQHLPGARHKDAAAMEETAPRAATTSTGVKRIISSSVPSPTVRAPTEKDILIVASKLKAYIQSQGDMNTSASVMDILSDKVRALCDRAIENARADGRKTVMERDFAGQ